MTFNDTKYNVSKKEEQYMSFIVTFAQITCSSNSIYRDYAMDFPWLTSSFQMG